MNDPSLDRRKHKRFRILYLDFRSFWNRFILGKKAPEGAAARRPPTSPAPKPSPQDPPGHGMTAGLRKISEQHQELREAILHLQKELRHPAGDGSHVNAIEHLLHKMNAHFRFEEAYLEHSGHPDLAKQHAEHEQCLAHITELKARAGAGDTSVPLELSTYLFDWLRLHTLQEEAAFSNKHPGA